MFVTDYQNVNGFLVLLWFPPMIKLSANVLYAVKYLYFCYCDISEGFYFIQKCPTSVLTRTMHFVWIYAF